MSLLADFAANEIGWDAVLSRLTKAQTDYIRRAAEADTLDEHLDLRGRMRGIAQALTLIADARNEFRKTQ